MNSSAFWSGKSVFLTGHTGFKGSWLSLLLDRLGARVTGFADGIPTTPSLYEAASVANALTDRRGDITVLAEVGEAMRASAPEIVVHMAAQPIVKVGYSDPILTYATNVMGTAHVLQAARDCPSVRVILVVTTDKCYDNREWPWGYRETDALGGHDPYSASKACAELVTSSFRSSFFHGPDCGVAVTSARAGNVIGGGDFAADRILPDAYRAFARGAALQVRNPRAVRPWQHVLDPLWGYLTLIERAWDDVGGFSEAWNFGPGSGNEQPVEALVAGIVARWGDGARWQQEFGDHAKE
ncbi:MAG: CDP-glucose 4,6-dehydratase, partial [Ancalomicrobiaceae bacterium]|nr:CDP-glucose 4,6-dehydratase [Ancalomicrobiaceae bacterium]